MAAGQLGGVKGGYWVGWWRAEVQLSTCVWGLAARHPTKRMRLCGEPCAMTHTTHTSNTSQQVSLDTRPVALAAPYSSALSTTRIPALSDPRGETRAIQRLPSAVGGSST